MSGLRRVVQAALQTPWAILPEKLEQVLDVLRMQANGRDLSIEEIRARVGDPEKPVPRQGAGVAVLPLYGIIGQKMNMMMEMSGGTSTEQFAGWFRAALADPAIGAIVIDVDSPGGSVQGVQELADLIYGSRGQKSIVAVANSLAASAAYWVASAADELWVTPSGDVGSIGVYTMHEDLSGAMDHEGVKVTMISAGKFKTEGNPYEPLSEEARDALQDRVDEMYRTFVGSVARHRGISAADVIANYGEGRLVSATKAKRAGMVDRVGTLDNALGRAATGTRRLKAEDMEPVVRLSAGTTTMTFNDSMGTLTYLDIPPEGTVIAPSVWVCDGLEPETAGGAAAPAGDPPPDQADEAKETTMPEGTAAAPAVDQAAEAAKQDRARIDALAALAADEHVDAATLKGWIANGTTEAQANREVLAKLKADRKDPIGSRETPIVHDRSSGPFRSLGEQLVAIIQSSKPGGRVDERLYRVNETYAAASGASATVGPDGGFLIQKDRVIDLMKDAVSGGVLAPRCSTTEISADSDGLEVVQFDHNNRGDGYRWGGVQVYRRAEAETVTATKPSIDNWECRLEDMMGLAYVTDRLMKDASAMGAIFSEAFRDEMGFRIDDEIFRGTGVGQCQGVLGAACAVTVAKEDGQAADTIVAENIIKMWSRIHPSSRARGAWFYNVECDTELPQMQIGTGTSGQLVYLPPGGLSGSQYGTIYGRPVIPIEHAEGLGTKGDICFLDLERYKLIVKGGIEEEESIHVRFVYNERTLKWNTRINGKPKDKAPLTPYKGTSTLSPFVFLATRA